MMRFKAPTTRSLTPPGRWTVPPHMRGLACQACGKFFQDGESHGEMDWATGEIACAFRTVRVYRQSLAVRLTTITTRCTVDTSRIPG
jgi:hypothetical protein